jgi:hypothetical protein
MNEDDFYDFRLSLKYFQDPDDDNKEKILVFREGISPGNFVLYEVPWIDTTTNKSLKGPDGLIKMGSKIADMLLPGPIRHQFIKKWQYGKQKIRLRLQYPSEEFEDENDAQNQIAKLAKIPWEYIYLYEHPGDNPPIGLRTRFLGLRDEISIVHSLRPYPWSLQKPSYVDKLKVKMKYFSWLGSGDEKADQDIRQGFVNEYPNLRAILDHSGNDTDLLDLAKIPAESHRLRTALQNDDFIHITCHGDADGISLLDGEYNRKEWLLETDLIRKIKAKVIILLSCDAAGLDSGGSLISELNRGGVPITIGMTKNINYEAAQRFVKGLFNALATWPVDGLERAIVHGRLSISDLELDIPNESQNDFETGNWHAAFGMPRLFLNSNLKNSVLIPEYLLYTPVTNVARRFCVAIDAVAVKDPEYGQLWRDEMEAWINHVPKALQRQWLLVTGPAGEGKTTQIKLLLKSLESARKPCKQLNSDDQQEAGEEASGTSAEGMATAPPPGEENTADGEEAASGDANPANPTVCPPKIVFHFCDDDYPETGRTLDFVRDSLVPQLIALYKDIGYKEAIPKGQFPRLVHNADQALWDFVITPLSKLIIEDQKIKKPVVVIDNLNFVLEFQDPANSVLGLLFRYRDRLQTIARFLVTADYVEMDPLDLYGQQMERPNEISATIYELTHHDPGDEDIIVISSPESSSFLFDALVTRFEANGFQLSSIPQGREWRDFYDLLDIAIANAIDAAAKDKSHPEDWWRQHLLRFLNIIAILVQPLSASDIAAIAGLFPDGAEKKRLLSILSPFLKPGDNITLSFYHKRLKSYILNKIRYKYDSESLADTHKLLVDAFRPASGQWADLNWQTLEGSKWPRQSDEQSEAMSRYIRKFLAYHAYHSCYYTSWWMLNIRRERARAYLDLICDSGFRKMRFDTVRRQMALQDIWLGLRIIMAEHIHDKSPQKDNKNHTKARVGFDRLFSANQHHSYNYNQLIKLETKLRTDPAADWQELFSFLGFQSEEERVWWKDC